MGRTRRSRRWRVTGAVAAALVPLVVIDPAAGGGPLIVPAVLARLLPVLGGAAHIAVLALDRLGAQAASSTSPPGATSAANVA